MCYYDYCGEYYLSAGLKAKRRDNLINRGEINKYSYIHAKPHEHTVYCERMCGLIRERCVCKSTETEWDEESN